MSKIWFTYNVRYDRFPFFQNIQNNPGKQFLNVVFSAFSYIVTLVGDEAFPVACGEHWNKLPSDVISFLSLAHYRKSILFHYYPVIY